MRLCDGFSPVATPVATPATPKAPPQHPADAFAGAMASASGKTHPSSSGRHTSSNNVFNGERTNLRGYAFSDHSSVSVKENGDFELERTLRFNYVSPDLEVTKTQSSSLEVKTVTPGEEPKGESESESTDEKSNPLLAKTNWNLLEAQGSTGASAWSKTFSDSHAYLTVSALGVEASGQASVGFMDGGFGAQASGSAAVYAADVKAGFHDGPLTASGEAMVGAGVNGNAQAAVDPLKGDADVNAGVSAQAGAFTNETTSLGGDGTSVSETAGVGVGVGIDAKLNAGIEDGDIHANFDLGGYVGIGGNADFSVNVNVPKVAEGAWHDTEGVAKGAWHDAKSLVHDIASFL